MNESTHKRITYLEKRSDLSRSQFSQHWSTDHAEIALDLPGLACYLQNHIISTRDLNEATDWTVDGIVELWFQEQDVVSAASDSDVAARLAVDEQRFLSGLSGGPVSSEPPHHAWPYKVWLLARLAESTQSVEKIIESGLHLPGLRGTNINTEAAGPRLVRSELRTMQRPPQMAIAWGFDAENDAEAAVQTLTYSLLRSGVLEQGQLCLAEEKVILAPR